MVTINLHQPGKINYTIDFPSEWNDLFPAEVMEISRQLIAPDNTEEKQRAAILKFIIEYRTKFVKKKLPPAWMNRVDAEQAVLQGFPLLDFIFQQAELTNIPESSIRLAPFHTVYGPAKGFQDITCGEYEDAEIFINQFQEKAEADHLAAVASILWRRKNIPYVKFNRKKNTWITYDSEKNKRLFLKLHPERLYSIFLWYAGNRHMLPKLFPLLHEGGEKKNTEPDMLVFTKCIHAGAGPKNGTRDQIRRMKLFEFMFDMEEEAKKAKELEEYYNSQK